MSFGASSYFTLVILGLLALGLGFWKKRTLKLIILYFAVSGVTYLFDYIVYVWGKAYKYKPGIIEGTFDSHLGGMINAHILPSFAVMYIAMKCKWYWSVVLAIFFTGIELLFTQWDLFKSNWWSHWYTFIGLLFYFPIAKLWWSKLNEKSNKWLFFGTLTAIFYSLFIPFNLLLYGLFKTRTYHVEWIESIQRDSTAFNSLTAILFGILLAYLSIINSTKISYILILFLFITYDFLLKYVGIVKVEKAIVDPILSYITFFLALLFIRYAGIKIKAHSLDYPFSA